MRCFASVGSLALLAVVACRGGAKESEPPAPSEPPPAPEIKRKPQPAEGEIDPKSLVKLRLVADVAALAPGEPLQLAAVYDIKPGWHVYWINPGDSGLSTTAEFSGPDGFSIGETRYPGPVEFRSPGDIVSYGYKETAVLFADVEVPAELPERAAFSVHGEWLACAEVCVRGEADAELVLPRGAAAPANESLFAKFRERLPRPLTEIGLSRRAGPTLLVADPDVAYFPENDVGGAKLERVGEATRVTLPSEAQGVLRVGDAYYDVR